MRNYLEVFRLLQVENYQVSVASLGVMLRWKKANPLFVLLAGGALGFVFG